MLIMHWSLDSAGRLFAEWREPQANCNGAVQSLAYYPTLPRAVRIGAARALKRRFGSVASLSIAAHDAAAIIGSMANAGD